MFIALKIVQRPQLESSRAATFIDCPDQQADESQIKTASIQEDLSFF